MDDRFFTKLREIQKKERANSSLARVRSDFYKKTHKYLDNIMDIAVNDPFSEESDLLKSVQRIATEICEMREHKIADAAVMNIHRSYHLFQGKSQFDLVDTTPLNITEEEEKLYFSFIDVLKTHRRGISLDQLTTNDNEVVNSFEININENYQKSTPKANSNKTIEKQVSKSNNSFSDNQNRNDSINLSTLQKSQKPEAESKIEKELNKDKNQINKESNNKSNEKVNKSIKSIKPTNFSQDDKNKNKNFELDNIIGNGEEQFIDLDNINIETTDNFDPGNFNIFNNTRSTADKIVNTMILIFSNVNPIIGVDEKIYGPFKSQDIVIMPDINANILVKSKKGRLVKI